jgi:outer membrane protein OmpA-like peptidoglycan-associated protein
MFYQFFIARPSTALFASISLCAISVGVCAQEVKTLRGKPSSDMILEALTPGVESDSSPSAPAVNPVRRKRGLSLNTDDALPASNSQSTSIDQAPVIPQPAASPSPAVQKTAAAQVSQPSPQSRALDLEIQFQFNSDQLTNDGKDVLDQLASALKSEKLSNAREVLLEGHADAKGTASYNQTLSLKRAESARRYLNSRHNIPANKLRALGKGSSELADPANPESEINRRVRVILSL